jgi:hypothetical protein
MLSHASVKQASLLRRALKGPKHWNVTLQEIMRNYNVFVREITS